MKKFLPALLTLFSSAAWAQSGEAWFSAGESILSNHNLGSLSPTGQPTDVQLDNGFRFGFRFGFNSAGRVGHEIQYAYSRTDFIDKTGAFFGAPGSQGMGIHTGGYNFLYYATPEGSRIRPFATGGVHFSNFVPPGSSAASGGGSTKFGINYGAGVKVKVSSKFAVRLDLREYETPKPGFSFCSQVSSAGTCLATSSLYNQSGWLRQTEASVGFGLYF